MSLIKDYHCACIRIVTENMKKQTGYLIAVSIFFLISACAKHELTPGETVKEFYNAESKPDVERIAATLAPDLRSKILADKNEAMKSFVETKAEIDKCGGFKNFTSKYDVSPESNKVVGYTHVEYNGSCPTEKQSIRLSKFDDKWLIDEFGPNIKSK